MASVGASLASARARLGGSQSARFDAALLLADTLGTDTAWLLAHDRAALSLQAQERYRAAVERRAAGEPVPYITGVAGFYGRLFAVTPEVLVPRPESEQLVALTLAHIAPHPAPRICDVGTGSGILAITLALESPASDVTAIDLSRAALGVAAKNMEALGVRARVTLLHGDTLDPIPRPQIFDAIVANLPYVRSADLAPAPDPTSFEPRIALDGGSDGLGLYRRLLTRAPGRLAAGGILLMEAGPDTTSPLAALAAGSFPEGSIRVHRDLSGLDRTVEVTLRARS